MLSSGSGRSGGGGSSGMLSSGSGRSGGGGSSGNSRFEITI